MCLRSRSNWTKHLDFSLADLICLNLAYILAYALRFRGEMGSGYVNLLIVINFLEIFASFVTNNLSDVLKRGHFIELVNCAVLAFVTMLLSTLYMFTAHNSGAFSRMLIFLTFSFFTVFTFIVRSVIKKLNFQLQKIAASDVTGRSVFIVTEAALADEIIKDLRADFYIRFKFRTVGVHKNSLCFAT